MSQRKLKDATVESFVRKTKNNKDEKTSHNESKYNSAMLPVDLAAGSQSLIMVLSFLW